MVNVMEIDIHAYFVQTRYYIQNTQFCSYSQYWVDDFKCTFLEFFPEMYVYLPTYKYMYIYVPMC